MIEASNIKKSFKSSTGARKVLEDISFTIPDSSFTTIFGPNGCGKSTLVNILAGLEKADSGTISGTSKLNKNIGYVFQDYRRSLLPWQSVKENILFPLKIRGMSSADQEKSLSEILELTGIKLDLKQKVYSLSGGQAQATCILRALIIKPTLLILDEPFAALDYERTISLREVISKVSKHLNLTVLLISHDLDEAIALGDQVLFLTRTPTKVEEILKVNLPYPRNLETTASKEFIEIKKEAINIFNRCIL